MQKNVTLSETQTIVFAKKLCENEDSVIHIKNKQRNKPRIIWAKKFCRNDLGQIFAQIGCYKNIF